MYFQLPPTSKHKLIVHLDKIMLQTGVQLNFCYQTDAVIQGKSGTESLMRFNPVNPERKSGHFVHNYQTRPPLLLAVLCLDLLTFFAFLMTTICFTFGTF